MTTQLSLFGHLPAHARQKTIEQVQRELDANKHNGSSCPCCGHMVKVYKRSIHAQMAAWLIELCQQSYNGQWVNQTALTARGGDYAKLLHWGLVEHRPKDPADKARRTSGQWRPTAAGRSFADGQTLVEQYAYIYRGQCIGYGSTAETLYLVNIHDCLGERFDFAELWGR